MLASLQRAKHTFAPFTTNAVAIWRSVRSDGQTHRKSWTRHTALPIPRLPPVIRTTLSLTLKRFGIANDDMAVFLKLEDCEDVSWPDFHGIIWAPLAVRPVQIRGTRVVMRPAACCRQLISFLLEHTAVACSPSTAAREPLSTLQTKLGDRRRQARDRSP